MVQAQKSTNGDVGMYHVKNHGTPCENNHGATSPFSNTIKGTSTIMNNPFSEYTQRGVTT